MGVTKHRKKHKQKVSQFKKENIDKQNFLNKLKEQMFQNLVQQQDKN